MSTRFVPIYHFPTNEFKTKSLSGIVISDCVSFGTKSYVDYKPFGKSCLCCIIYIICSLSGIVITDSVSFGTSYLNDNIPFRYVTSRFFFQICQ